jgi:hypothetical protein
MARRHARQHRIDGGTTARQFGPFKEKHVSFLTKQPGVHRALLALVVGYTLSMRYIAVGPALAVGLVK